MSACIGYIKKEIEKKTQPLKTYINKEVKAVLETDLNDILKKAEKKYA